VLRAQEKLVGGTFGQEQKVGQDGKTSSAAARVVIGRDLGVALLEAKEKRRMSSSLWDIFGLDSQFSLP
jgi:hypothetical protein